MNEFQTIDPARQKPLKTYAYATSAEIDAALERVAVGAETDLPIAEKKTRLQRLAGGLRARSENLARLISQEMGKPIKDARGEIEKSATAADFAAENIEKALGEESVQLRSGARYKILYQGTGPLFAIMPWNFPVWQIMRVLPAAMTVGNPVVLKHSDSVAGTAELFGTIVQDAFGPHFFQNLRADHATAAKVIADRRIRSVTMTGSGRGGREVAAIAGRELKKVVLELGGSDAYLVFEDADVKKAATLCAQSRLLNNGQSCICAKRFLVQESVWDDFLAVFQEELAKGVVGDPLQEQTTLGPLAQVRFRDGLQKQTRELEHQGGKRLFQRRLDLNPELEQGAYFGAELWQVTGQEKIAREDEFFGPVALAMKFKSEEDALQLANASVFGLGGGVFSRDRARLDRIARGLRCGFVALNDYVRSDPHVPFGGVKDSGFGRELGLPAGFVEFANIKTLGNALEI